MKEGVLFVGRLFFDSSYSEMIVSKRWCTKVLPLVIWEKEFLAVTKP
jgi:hypothetical protein